MSLPKPIALLSSWLLAAVAVARALGGQDTQQGQRDTVLQTILKLSFIRHKQERNN